MSTQKAMRMMFPRALNVVITMRGVRERGSSVTGSRKPTVFLSRIFNNDEERMEY